MNPSNTSLRPVARNIASPDLVRSTDGDHRLIEFCRRHLAGNETRPDQLVQPIFIRPEFGVRFLRRKFASVGRIASWASWALLLLDE